MSNKADNKTPQYEKDIDLIKLRMETSLLRQKLLFEDIEEPQLSAEGEESKKEKIRL